MGYIIVISGLSGVGKSTVTALIAKQLDAVLIRQDDYFQDDKPRVTLSNGITVKNWDADSAVDFDAFNLDVLEARYSYAHDYIIVEGFNLVESKLKFVPDLHIHLSYTDSEKLVDIYNNVETITDRVINSRKESKSNIKNDELMVKEVVIPYYLNRLKDTKINHVVPTYIGDDRISIDAICSRVQSLIDNGLRK